MQERKLQKLHLLRPALEGPTCRKRNYNSFSLDWIGLSRETQKTCRRSSFFTPCAGKNYEAGKLRLMRLYTALEFLGGNRLYSTKDLLKVAERRTSFVSWGKQSLLSPFRGPGPSRGRIAAGRPPGSASEPGVRVTGLAHGMPSQWVG